MKRFGNGAAIGDQAVRMEVQRQRTLTARRVEERLGIGLETTPASTRRMRPM